MNDKNSNIGQKGPESIRINGMRIDDLPMAEAAQVKAQMPDVLRNETDNKERDIRARFPPGNIPQYESRVRECRKNIQRLNDQRDQLSEEVLEYQSLIVECRMREKLETKLAHDPDREEKIQQLRRDTPPYNVEAMERQIEQFKLSIRRCEDTIANEHSSIELLKETIGKVKQRDLELKAIGR